MARTLIVGLDVGNWRQKISYSVLPTKKGATAEAKQLSIRSAIDLIGFDLVVDFPDCITCESQDSHWDGQSWFAVADGDMATINEDFGKPRYALPLLVSAMWNEIANKDCLKVALSVPRKVQLGDPTRDALNGKHTFTRNGVSKTVDIEVLQVFNEGVGVLFNERPLTKRNYLLEVGGGTANVSVFDRITPVCPPYVSNDAGSRCLLSEIRNCDESIKANNGSMLSLAAATTIVETPGHMITLASGTYDFSEVIDREVDKWLTRLLDDVNKNTKQHQGEHIDQMFASGGICQLDAVADWLQKKGFTVVKNPEYGNCLGLHAWASRELTKKVTA